MASVTLEIPDELMTKLKKQNPDVGHGLLRLAAAFSLCNAGDLSTSQAARLAGMTYGEFLEAAARAKVMLYPINIEELKEEISRGFTLGRQCVPDHPGMSRSKTNFPIRWYPVFVGWVEPLARPTTHLQGLVGLASTLDPPYESERNT